MGFMGGLGRLMGSASAGAVAVSGASTLLSGETQGLALDFTDSFWQPTTGFYGSARVIDTGTPANNYNTSPTTTAASLLTYTSPSAKMCMGPGGLLRFGAMNLFVQSEDFNTTWGKSNVTVTVDQVAAPDGAVTADLVTATGSGAALASAVVTAFGYEVSFRAKRIASDWVAVSNATHFAYFNINTGVVGTVGDGSASITDLGGGWWHCKWVPATVANNTQFRIRLASADNATATTTESAYLWGAQLRRLPSETTYLKTVASVRYALPLEWSTAGVLQGLLVEEARTNLVTYSDDLTNAAWTKTSLTTAKTATGPDGVANSATTLTASAANASAQQRLTSASAARITSLHIKRRTGSGVVGLSQSETTGSDLIVNGTFTTDTSSWTATDATLAVNANRLEVTNTGTNGGASQIVTVTVGKVYRVSVDCTDSTGVANVNLGTSLNGGQYRNDSPGTGTSRSTFVATTTSLYVSLRSIGGAGAIALYDNVVVQEVVETALTVTSSWTRVATSSATVTNPAVLLRLATSGDAVDVALVQHEVGAFVTSPIPTIGATATRAVDNISLATSAFPYSATAGSAFAQLTTSTTPVAILSGASNFPVYGFAGLAASYDGTNICQTTGAMTAGNTYKCASAWSGAANGLRACRDGGTVAKNSFDGAMTVADIGFLYRPATGQPTTGYLKKVVILPRDWSDAELQSKTTP